MVIVYPVARLLANPQLFTIISNHLGFPPDPELLRNCFYDLLESEVDGVSDDDLTFQAEEVCFSAEDDGISISIEFDTGSLMKLEAVEGNFLSQISTEHEFRASSAIHRRLISAIEESNPELKDDISLENPPTPGNGFLSSEDGDGFEGLFHLRSDPDKKFAFSVQIVDPVQDKLKAEIRQI